MKRLFLFLILSLTTLGAGDFLSNQEFMSAEQAAKKWGESKFDSGKFRKSDSDMKARREMAVDLVKNKIFIGKKVADVLSALGPSTGYFWSDRIPAYLLSDARTSGIPKESWQIVFLSDSNNIITDVKIHKNCCSQEAPYDPKKLKNILNQIDVEKSGKTD